MYSIAMKFSTCQDHKAVFGYAQFRSDQTETREIIWERISSEIENPKCP